MGPLKLSLAILLVASASAAMTLKEFIQDSQVRSLAPNLVDKITAQGLDSFSDNSQDSSGLKLPPLNDIVQVVSRNIFHAGDADWSRLEQAKVKATRELGPDGMAIATNLTDVDTRRAAFIVDTIYDTVINLPPLSKESYKAMKESSEVDHEHKEGDGEETDKKADTPSSMWDYLGSGLIKSSNTVKKVQGIVGSSNACETKETAYLKGVDDVVYYSSLTHGFARGALVSAPEDSTVKSLDLQPVVSAIGKLAIEIHMAQNVARLAALNPADPPIRTMTYLALASDSSTSTSAQMAHDIHNLVNQGIADNIPSVLLRSLADQASLQLVTHEARSGSAILNNIPVVRNLYAYSTEVLDANSMGDVLKYVFCPETPPSMTEQVVDKIKEGAEEVAEKGSEAAQIVFKASEDTAKNVVEEAKKKGYEAKDKVGEAAYEAKAKMGEAAEKVTEESKKKGQEAKAKVGAAAESVVEESKKKGHDAKAKMDETAEYVTEESKKKGQEAKAKVGEAKAKVGEAAESVIEESKKKGQEAKAKVGEAKAKVGETAEYVTEESKKKGQEAKAKMGEAAEKVTEESKKKAHDAKAKMDETAETVAEESKKKGHEAKSKLGEAVEYVIEKVKGVKDETAAKASEAGSNIKDKKDKFQEKVLEGTEKVNDKGEQMAQDAKDTAAGVKKRTEENVEAAKEKMTEEKEAAKEKAQEMRDAAGKKGEEVKEKAQEMRDAAGKKGEEVKHKAEEIKQKAAKKVEGAREEL